MVILRILLPAAAALALIGAVPGCRRAPEPDRAEAPAPRHLKQVIGGTPRLRIYLDYSPNPPYVGLNAFDVAVTDPQEMLRPVPNASVKVRMTPPPGAKVPVVERTVVTDREGKATAKIPLAAPGDWTMKATAFSKTHGTASVTAKASVRTIP